MSTFLVSLLPGLKMSLPSFRCGRTTSQRCHYRHVFRPVRGPFCGSRPAECHPSRKLAWSELSSGTVLAFEILFSYTLSIAPTMAELTMLETLLDGISPSTERKLYDIFTSPQDDDPVSPLKHMFQNLSKVRGSAPLPLAVDASVCVVIVSGAGGLKRGSSLWCPLSVQAPGRQRRAQAADARADDGHIRHGRRSQGPVLSDDVSERNRALLFVKEQFTFNAEVC